VTVGPIWRTSVWKQFGAAIDMLENAMHACPDPLWRDRSRFPEFWYLVYHTLFWLDYHLADSETGFAPPAPFTLDELDPAGVLPDRVYEKAELQAYLDHGRMKCRATIEGMTEERAGQRCGFARREMNNFELLLYSLRHVQHHAAQLNLILRQEVDAAPTWVGQTPGDLGG
jgi:hypothetical protein